MVSAARSSAQGSKYFKVLQALAGRDGEFSLDVTPFDWGSDYYRRHGTMMPADGLKQLRAFDAIYFGAVGAPFVPDHITLWGLRLAICQPFDQYANVRPIRILPGIVGLLPNVAPADLDWVIVRENSEGEYSGQGGRQFTDRPMISQARESPTRSHRSGRHR